MTSQLVWVRVVFSSLFHHMLRSTGLYGQDVLVYVRYRDWIDKSKASMYKVSASILSNVRFYQVLLNHQNHSELGFFHWVKQVGNTHRRRCRRQLASLLCYIECYYSNNSPMWDVDHTRLKHRPMFDLSREFQSSVLIYKNSLLFKKSN